MNKKGEVATGFLIYLALGLIVLGVVGYLFLNAGSRAGDVIGTIDPGALSLRSTSCGNALNNVDYCRFTEAGKNNHINCNYREDNFLGSFDNDKGLKCDGDTDKKFCDNLQKDDDFVLAEVNGRECKKGSDFNSNTNTDDSDSVLKTCKEAIDGDWKGNCAEGENSYSENLKDSGDHPDEICCYAVGNIS